MNATTASTTPATTLDVSGTPPIPFARLVGVEVRKMTDTRSGRWLLAAIVAITAVIVVLLATLGQQRDHDFLSYMSATAPLQGYLLPVLGILLVTSEWSQRTTMTTFTLEPSRGKVIAAKIAAAILFGLAAIAVAVAVAALAAAVSGAPDAWTGIGVDDFAKFAVLEVSGILMGLAFGLLFLNSPAAIVTYLVLPTAFTIVASIWTALHRIAAWVDTGTAQAPLFSGTDVSGKEWAQVAVSSAIWILLPLAVGWWRVLRAEVK
jgi:ABC-2 type transport system permease protein